MILRHDQSLKELNTFGLDVSAKTFAEVFSEDDIQEVKEQIGDLEMMILGGGSNVLFTKDYDGLVIKNSIRGTAILEESADRILLRAYAGHVWHDLVLHTVDQGWGGIENLSLIPGQVGAAPMQNIGAYGVELEQVFDSLRAFHIQSGEIHTFDRQECQFGYRESVFKRKLKGQYIILSIDLWLSKNPIVNISYGAIRDTLEDMGVHNPTIKDVSKAVIQIRQQKLPDPKELGNAGSFFKNPVIDAHSFNRLLEQYPEIPNYPQPNGMVKVPAGWLIEKSGWKGKRNGFVGMHERQALVLVNYGEATGDQLIDHAKLVRESVHQQFGIELEFEVNII